MYYDGYSSVAATKPRSPRSVTPPTANKIPYKRNRKGQFRPVIIDGCNVGYQYGRNDDFDAEGLIIAYKYFKNLGYEDKKIIIIIKHMPRLTDDDIRQLDFLRKIG